MELSHNSTMSMPFLSFNEANGKISNQLGVAGIPEEESEEVRVALMEPMKLKHKWWLWEQVVQSERGTFTDALRKVVSFDTVQDFWSIWNGLPQPGELLDQKRITREMPSGPAVAIDAIMIFRDGISPEWEHPMNSTGGHFQMMLKPTLGAGQIDEYWNNIVLGMIGHTIEPAELITGIRLVDKLSGPKSNTAIRIELWYSKASEAQVNALRRSMEKCMATRLDGSQGQPPKPESKSHSTIGKH